MDLAGNFAKLFNDAQGEPPGLLRGTVQQLLASMRTVKEYFPELAAFPFVVSLGFGGLPDNNGRLQQGGVLPVNPWSANNRAVAGTPTIARVPQSGMSKQYVKGGHACVACAAAAQPAVVVTLTCSVLGEIWSGSLAAPVNDGNELCIPEGLVSGVGGTLTLAFAGVTAAGVAASVSFWGHEVIP